MYQNLPRSIEIVLETIIKPSISEAWAKKSPLA